MLLTRFKLSKQVQDFYKHMYGRSAPAYVLTHLRRELMHKVWAMLLEDPEFRKAYEEGILIKCFDGKWHLIFPRFFAYIADYPEKCVCSLIHDGLY